MNHVVKMLIGLIAASVMGGIIFALMWLSINIPILVIVGVGVPVIYLLGDNILDRHN